MTNRKRGITLALVTLLVFTLREEANVCQRPKNQQGEDGENPLRSARQAEGDRDADAEALPSIVR